MFNLVQIQEDLKGLPTQAIMSYANGQNPQVPPYIALAELNRRKQLEQSIQQGQQAAPQGTLKDQIEQGVGLQALQAQRQKQAMAQIGQQAENSPGTEQVSEPAQQSPAFAGGGIVALAGAGVVNGEDSGGDPEGIDDKAKRRRMLAEFLGGQQPTVEAPPAAPVQGATAKPVFGIQAPAAPTLQGSTGEAMGITQPFVEQSQAASKEYYDLMKQQQAQREKDNPWNAAMAWLGGASRNPSGRWQEALANAGSAYQATTAEQQRIKEAAEQEQAKLKMGIADLPLANVKDAMGKGSDFASKIYGDKAKVYGSDTAAMASKYHTDASVKQANQQADKALASQNIQAIAESRKSVEAQLRAVESDLRVLEPNPATDKAVLDELRAQQSGLTSSLQRLSEAALNLGGPKLNAAVQTPPSGSGNKKVINFNDI
jgi:hypothetical protein